MNKNLLFLLCINVLSFSADIKPKKKDLNAAPANKKDLYLVVGSLRKSSMLEGKFPYTQLWRENVADLSHVHTYKGNATTFHFNKCHLSGIPHITGDPRYYNFKDYNIKAVYLEQPFPHTRAVGFGTLHETEQSYIQHSIKHLGCHMPPNTIMEIEWLPFVIIDDASSISEQHIFSKEYSDQYPFGAKIHKDLLYKSLELLLYRGSQRNDNFLFSFRAKKLSSIMEKFIAFYDKQKVAPAYLLKRRLQEELLSWEYLKNEKCIAALSAGPSASPKSFSDALKKFYIADLNADLTKTINQLPDNNLSVYHADSILSSSFLYCLLCDIAAEYNKPYVIHFMKENGFKKVTMERKASPHNKRKNVWIITAKKK
jgi:hypothetical protein